MDTKSTLRQAKLPTETQKTKAATTLGTMLDYLGINATVTPSERGPKIILNVNSSESGKIIGRQGSTMNNMQFLLNRMMQNAEAGFPITLINVDGYRPPKQERRPIRSNRNRMSGYNNSTSPEILRRRALEVAKEVKRWGEPVTLPPMNAHDRRIIHLALRDEPGITTESIEEGRMKRVVVKLEPGE